MNIISVSQFLLIAMIGMAAGLPAQQRASDDANEAETSPRFRRRVGNFNATTIPLKYILDLYESAYENGIPTDKATDVWVFADKDIAKESFREKPFVNTKCTSYTQYIFQWSSVSELIQFLSVRNSTLRVYMQTINRHFKNDDPVDVTLTVTMVPRDGNGTANTSDLSDGILAGQEVMTVSRGAEGWIDLNVTEGADSILPQMQKKNYTDLQVIIKAEVNCNEQKKVPFNLINPAEIPLDQANRRERQMDNQPIFVIFADNEETKEAIRQQEEEAVTGDAPDEDLGDIQTHGPWTQSKRSTSSSCQRSDYIVDLHELGLTNVVAPHQINISKCSGNCNERRVINRLGTNHAKIMASIYNRQTYFGEPVTATVPCCVPTKYEPVFLLMHTLDGTATGIKSHNYLQATECGCR